MFARCDVRTSVRLYLFLWAALALFPGSSAYSQESNPVCSPDISPIVVPITGKTATDLPVRSLEMTFENASKVMSDGTSQPYVRPSIRFRVGVDLTKAASQFCDEARREVEGASLTFTGCSLAAPQVSPTRLTLPGTIGVEKWWSMTGFCCQWFSCHRCEWKTKIFGRSVSAYSNFDRNVAREMIAAGSGPTANKATGKTDVSFVLSGGTNDDRSGIEQIWDFLAGFISWLGHVFGESWKVKFSDILGQQLNSSTSQPIDPMNFLVSDEKSFGFSPAMSSTLKLAEFKQRGVWDAFYSSLDFSERTSIFEGAGTTSFLISFPLDYDIFLKTLENIYETSPNPILITDPLYTPNFCAVGRDEAVKYLNHLAQTLQNTPRSSYVVTVPRGTATEALEHHFELGGVSEYLISTKHLVVGKKTTLINSPPLNEIISSPGTMPSGGSLDGLAFEQGWSNEEITCSKRLAMRRWHSELRVRPFESFDSCLSSDPVSVSQKRSLLKVLNSEAGKNILESSLVSAPVFGTPAYRGWFSCKSYPHVCGPTDQIAWWQEPSKFGHASNRSHALQLVDAAASDGITKAKAITSGGIVANYSDRSWGNAILQPFKKDGRTFIAVYGHLTRDSMFAGVRSIDRDSVIGIAGCNDDALGRCDQTCSVNSRPRLQQHILFELVEYDPGNIAQPFRKIEPTALLGFSIQDDHQRSLHSCTRPNSISSSIDWTPSQLRSLNFRSDSRPIPDIGTLNLDFIDPYGKNEVQKIVIDPNFFPRHRNVGDFRVETSVISPVTNKRVSGVATCFWNKQKTLATCSVADKGGRFHIRLLFRTRNIATSEFSLIIEKSGFRIGLDDVGPTPKSPNKISIALHHRTEMHVPIKF